MVKVTVNSGTTAQTYYLDGYLKSNLDIGKNLLRQDNDIVFLIDGAERAGKSVLAQQIAKYIDPTFNIDRIAFTPRQFMNAVKGMNKYQAVIYDEAFTGLMGRTSIQFVNISIVRMLAEVGQLNGCLLIVAPTFFDLDRYAALWRSKALLHVYRGSKFERGYFRYFGFENKKRLYIEGKKDYSYQRIRPDFSGRFTNFYTIPEAQYRALKYSSLTNRKDDVSRYTKLTEKQTQAYLIDKIAASDKAKELNLSLIKDVLGMKEATFWNLMHKAREKLTKSAKPEQKKG
jgi:hypothetical protein